MIEGARPIIIGAPRLRRMEGARPLVAAAALRSGVTVEIVAGGPSMRPLLRAGDRLRIAPVAAAALRLDDLAVIARDDGRLVAHRVIGLTPLVLRGDGCAGTDGPIDRASVLGRVVGFRRWGVEVALERPLGRALSRGSRRLGPWLRRLRELRLLRRYRRPS
jgi:hypothetical protein